MIHEAISSAHCKSKEITFDSDYTYRRVREEILVYKLGQENTISIQSALQRPVIAIPSGCGEDRTSAFSKGALSLVPNLNAKRNRKIRNMKIPTTRRHVKYDFLVHVYCVSSSLASRMSYSSSVMKPSSSECSATLSASSKNSSSEATVTVRAIVLFSDLGDSG